MTLHRHGGPGTSTIAPSEQTSRQVRGWIRSRPYPEFSVQLWAFPPLVPGGESQVMAGRYGSPRAGAAQQRNIDKFQVCCNSGQSSSPCRE